MRIPNSKIKEFFNHYGYNKCIKALAIFVIKPYFELIEKQDPKAQLACEKFLRDQFDGMYSAFEGSDSVSSSSLNDFYQEYLKDNYEEFKGALYEDSLYSEFNDSPNGPSQRITKLSLRLQTVTNRSSYSIDIVMDTMQEIFSMFLKGMFLPQEDDYELTSSFIEETIKFDYSESAGISIGFNDKIFGPELGHWVAEISTEKTRKQIWTEVQTNYQKYTEIIKELDEMINFIY